jgi:hypothetical protein
MRAHVWTAVLLAIVSFAPPALAAPPKKPAPAPEPSCPADTSSAVPEGEASAEELFRRGVCAEAERQPATAVNFYQAALRRGPAAPLAKRIQARSAKLAGKLASVRIDPGALPDGATAVVATKKYDLGTRRYVEPGKVEVEVAAPGYVSRIVSFELAVGEDRHLTIMLAPVAQGAQAVPAPPAPAPAAPPPVAPVTVVAPIATPVAAPPPTSSGWRPLGWIALGVAGAGLAVGGVTGYLALGHADDVRRECPTKTTCSAGGAAAARAGATESTVSTIATVGGGALALVGLAFVIWGGPKAAVRPSVGSMNGLVLSGEM